MERVYFFLSSISCLNPVLDCCPGMWRSHTTSDLAYRHPDDTFDSFIIDDDDDEDDDFDAILNRQAGLKPTGQGRSLTSMTTGHMAGPPASAQQPHLTSGPASQMAHPHPPPQQQLPRGLFTQYSTPVDDFAPAAGAQAPASIPAIQPPPPALASQFGHIDRLISRTLDTPSAPTSFPAGLDDGAQWGDDAWGSFSDEDLDRDHDLLGDSSSPAESPPLPSKDHPQPAAPEPAAPEQVPTPPEAASPTLASEVLDEGLALPPPASEITTDAPAEPTTEHFSLDLPDDVLELLADLENDDSLGGVLGAEHL
ncbi:hypothetical protein H696_02561 [Fonticula alba]|uniref:Uncharacterized protein n=1 Tax=Fonticula alba TaxID=691883 RepID=A0A058Z7Y4_FONAL|nr:hypothetical protein H696_02561 [Fonticula alba]KCV70231.1 hypothetical protein H696_02561 [Fonticula alba]|eukprot:XP_009494747.1 hypothetical protein H696_02561 [Fonticula alba]